MIWILLSLLSSPAAWALSADFTAYQTNEFRALANNPANPGNRIAEEPSRFHQAELRVEVKESAGPVGLTLRPRLKARLSRINGRTEGGAEAYFQEGFFTGHVADALTVTVGRIQYGWGPAESVTPSNWLAPEIQLQASPYFEQLGYYRAQANFTIGQNISIVGAAELQALRDRWADEDPLREAFKKRSFLKIESAWDNSNRVLGVVGGQERKAAGELWRAGAYGSYTLNDAWQFYFDGVLREIKPGSEWRRLLVMGARYTFENGAEVHLEGIENQAGYSPSQRRLLESSISSFSDASLRDVLLDRGTSLFGKGYAYASFGWPNPSFFPSWAQTPVLHVRALHALSDHSSLLMAASELGFRDHYTLALYAAFGMGAADSEMRQVFNRLGGFVVKYAF